MFELLALLFIGGILIFIGELNKWEFRDVTVYGVVILVVVIGYILRTKKPTEPNSDGY
jgi:membrane-bound ClpP family serine protease